MLWCSYLAAKYLSYAKKSHLPYISRRLESIHPSFQAGGKGCLRISSTGPLKSNMAVVVVPGPQDQVAHSYSERGQGVHSSSLVGSEIRLEEVAIIHNIYAKLDFLDEIHVVANPQRRMPK